MEVGFYAVGSARACAHIAMLSCGKGEIFFCSRNFVFVRNFRKSR